MQKYGDKEYRPPDELYFCRVMHMVFKTLTGRWVE